ncbi:MAG: hypothetical protein V2I41_07615 [Pseudomonadales bacterium]|nr:hypothetical protein [Pseudomonadales bacterium]
MAMFNQYLNADSEGKLPPYTEDQQYWWDQTVALFPDKDQLQQELTLAGQSFESYFLKASKNETNPNVTRKKLAAMQDATCSKYRIERKIRELKALRAKQQITLDAHKEILRREKAEQSIAFNEPPFVNLRNNETAATLDVYFSLGCNHCLVFLDQQLQDFLQLNQQGRLNLRFLEVPGLTPSLVGNGKVDRPTTTARQHARLASRYAACAAEKSPAHFVRYISQLIASAKNYLTNIETQTWAFYTHAVAGDFRAGSPYVSVAAMLEDTATKVNIAPSRCDEALVEKQTEQAFSRLKTLRGKINVPFYRFNRRYYFDATDHDKLMLDLQAYVSTGQAVLE